MEDKEKLMKEALEEFNKGNAEQAERAFKTRVRGQLEAIRATQHQIAVLQKQLENQKEQLKKMTFDPVLPLEI